ncbi:Protransforming growth factor alpha [Anabarilius grahami]|uniref:Protransforming growth factor alpha n=1 Tax=Anabarilius grahami TaxID=495550 RepID=A0A3N0YXZ3_ANAGA|nr:Protransforming growth factor alpha [Anabarilius grahami]
MEVVVVFYPFLSSSFFGSVALLLSLTRCHPGFVGMRCEHADLLAVVASNHRQQTVATMLVLCVVGSVLLMLLCTLLNGLTCINWSSLRCSHKIETPKSSTLLLDFTMTAFLKLQTRTAGKSGAY